MDAIFVSLALITPAGNFKRKTGAKQLQVKHRNSAV